MSASVPCGTSVLLFIAPLGNQQEYGRLPLGKQQVSVTVVGRAADDEPFALFRSGLRRRKTVVRHRIRGPSRRCPAACRSAQGPPPFARRRAARRSPPLQTL